MSAAIDIHWVMWWRWNTIPHFAGGSLACLVYSVISNSWRRYRTPSALLPCVYVPCIVVLSRTTMYNVYTEKSVLKIEFVLFSHQKLGFEEKPVGPFHDQFYDSISSSPGQSLVPLKHQNKVLGELGQSNSLAKIKGMVVICILLSLYIFCYFNFEIVQRHIQISSLTKPSDLVIW